MVQNKRQELSVDATVKDVESKNQKQEEINKICSQKLQTAIE